VISCNDAVRRLWAYLEDQVDADDRTRVEEHLALCRRCCGEAEFTAALRDLLRSTDGPELPPEVERHLTGFLDTLGREPA
jgi:anti-sigma factor (TIGR02949 family)